jgi:hypothetical protein
MISMDEYNLIKQNRRKKWMCAYLDKQQESLFCYSILDI